MSLQVWLPLIHDTKNHGLCGDVLTTSGITFADGGKLGSKYFSGGTITIPASISKNIFNNNNMSFAFWLYPMSSGTNIIMGQNPMSAGNNRMYSIFQYSSINDLHLSWQDETSSSTFLGGAWNGFFTADTWTHCCITYNGSKAVIYRNGEQYSTANGTSKRAVFEYDYPIVGSAIRRLNDVRIYNHCLSPKEVKEISKGLVLHYPLNRGGFGCDNLLENSVNFGTSWASARSKSETINTENGITYMKLWHSTTSSWTQYATYNYIFKLNQPYTVSLLARKTNTDGVDPRLCIRNDRDAAITFFTPGTGYPIDSTRWKYYSFSVNSVASATYTDKTEPLRFYAIMTNEGDNRDKGALNATSAIQIARVKLEEGSTPTPWIPNSADALYSSMGLDSNIEYDVSGYGNNGTKDGNISFISDTPRYKMATYFTSGSGIFSQLNITFSQFTISFWGKHTATGKMLMGSNTSLTSLNTSWYWYGDNSFKFPGGEFYYNHNAGSDQSLLNKWTHFVATYDGAVLTIYRNGVNEGTKAFTGDQLLQYVSVGNGFSSSSYWENGYVSDFRIYSTCLNSDDILELYHTPASIANNGTLMTQGELSEV